MYMRRNLAIDYGQMNATQNAFLMQNLECVGNITPFNQKKRICSRDHTHTYAMLYTKRCVENRSNDRQNRQCYATNRSRHLDYTKYQCCHALIHPISNHPKYRCTRNHSHCRYRNRKFLLVSCAIVQRRTYDVPKM